MKELWYSNGPMSQTSQLLRSYSELVNTKTDVLQLQGRISLVQHSIEQTRNTVERIKEENHLPEPKQ